MFTIARLLACGLAVWVLYEIDTRTLRTCCEMEFRPTLENQPLEDAALRLARRFERDTLDPLGQKKISHALSLRWVPVRKT
jgi:hypothetical protein